MRMQLAVRPDCYLLLVRNENHRPSVTLVYIWAALSGGRENRSSMKATEILEPDAVAHLELAHRFSYGVTITMPVICGWSFES